MGKTLLLDEIHLTVSVPRRLAAAKGVAIARVLHGRRFHSHLGRAVRAVFRRFPVLHPVRVHIAR